MAQTTVDNSLQDVIGKQTNRGIVSWLIGRQVFWVFLAVVAACLYLALATSTWFTPGNIFNITRNFAFVGIIAIGMTAVIITGGIDLSVGGVMLVSAMCVAVTMNSGMPLFPAMMIALGASLLIGLVNGIFIAVFKMPSFVVTLGMMSITRSLGMVISNNKLIYDFGPDTAAFVQIGGGATFGVPNPVFILIALGLIVGFAFRWTKWGRHLFAIGGNENAAILTGIPVKLVKISAYMLVALTAGIAGYLEVSWLGSAATNIGTGRELTVIAATVIGGANLMGGSGTAFGAVVGAALIEIIRNSLTLLGINPFWQGTFVGCAIVLAVSFDRLRNRETSE